jgi:hypothetical protein
MTRNQDEKVITSSKISSKQMSVMGQIPEERHEEQDESMLPNT